MIRRLVLAAAAALAVSCAAPADAQALLRCTKTMSAIDDLTHVLNQDYRAYFALRREAEETRPGGRDRNVLLMEASNTLGAFRRKMEKAQGLLKTARRGACSTRKALEEAEIRIARQYVRLKDADRKPHVRSDRDAERGE